MKFQNKVHDDYSIRRIKLAFAHIFAYFLFRHYNWFKRDNATSRIRFRKMRIWLN